MTAGEFIVQLGFSADTIKLKDFAKAIGEIPLDAAAAITALAGIELELTKIAQEAMNTAVGFQMFTSQTGLSWKELQKWQIVAEQANVSAEDVANSVSGLQRNIAEIRLGRGNIAPFQLLGIGINQDAFGVLTQLRERIRGLDRATATNLIAQMGLTPSMIQVLSLTNAQFAQLGKTVRGITGEQEGSFLRAKEQLVQFGLVAKYVGFDIVDHLIFGFQMLYDKVHQFKGALIAIGIVAAGVGAAFFPITAAMTALLLVLDDLSVYFKGGHSLFGDVMDGLEKFAGKIQAMIPGFKTLGMLSSILPAIPAGILPMMMQSAMGKAFNASQTTQTQPAPQQVNKTVTQNNTINVHSTAPAHDVGKAVKAEIDKGVAQASYQTNNQGY